MSPKLHVDTLKRVALDVELSASGHSSEESKEFDDVRNSEQHAIIFRYVLRLYVIGISTCEH